MDDRRWTTDDGSGAIVHEQGTVMVALRGHWKSRNLRQVTVTSQDAVGEFRNGAFPEREPSGREGEAALASASSAAASEISPTVISQVTVTS